MEPKSFGRKLGIGVRVASRVVKEHVNAHTQQTAQEAEAAQQAAKAEGTKSAESSAAQQTSRPEEIARQAAQTLRTSTGKAANTARAQVPVVAAKARGVRVGARRFGQAMWGPFAHVSSVLWSEVTGVFFGLFAVYFAQGIFRYRADHAVGLNHQKFVLDVILTLVFGYFAVSSFYIARRKEKRKRRS